MSGVTTGAVIGARVAAEIHSQDITENNNSNTKFNAVNTRSNAPQTTSRTPLTSVAPNRKNTNDNVNNTKYLHNRVEELGQAEKPISRSGSEPDSLLDLYKNNGSGHQTPDSDIPENMYKPEEYDPDGWIHRDKLAKIESEELQAAGINLAKSRQNKGKNSGRDSARGKRIDDVNGDSVKPIRDDKKRRVSEPVEEEEEEEGEGDHYIEEEERTTWDLRSPDEIAADASAAAQMYANPALKKSGSKIPILTSSPVPIPQEHLDRDTPVARKRTLSNSMTMEDGLPVLKTRSRKGSIGSQILLNDGENSPVSTPSGGKSGSGKPSSPTKMKPKDATDTPESTSSARKVGTHNARKPSNGSKNILSPPAGGTASPSQRPGTRSGDLDRPRTAVNRPEGDPPWLATMYKPDPMLPPDQQIIPTHARRQQQNQWTMEGAVPTTYDRNFSPLAVHPMEDLGKSQQQPQQLQPQQQQQHQQQQQQYRSQPSPIPPIVDEKNQSTNTNTKETIPWPLKPLPDIRHSQNGGRPGTSGSTTGGYSMMPKVSNPAIIQNSNSSTRIGSGNRIGNQRQNLDDPDDEKVNKKGCACCVVM